MKIGIVGGLGPESTVDYYKSIIAEYRKIITDGSYPQIVIDSVDMNEALGLLYGKDWPALVSLLSNALRNLSLAGADLAVIASNTPHIVFDQVQAKAPIPLLSIVEEAGKKAKKLKLGKVGLLGTAFTMKNNFYGDVFLKYGIETVVPALSEQEYIHEKIFQELELGIVKETTKNDFLRIINRMMKEEQIKGVILGCTEFPLILHEGDAEIPFINTVEVHVLSIIREIVKLSAG